MAKTEDSRHRLYPRAGDRDESGELLGLYDISDLLGVSRAAAGKWVERQALPEADGPDVNTYPSWRRRTILEWAEATKRAPDHVLLELKRARRDELKAAKEMDTRLTAAKRTLLEFPRH